MVLDYMQTQISSVIHFFSLYFSNKPIEAFSVFFKVQPNSFSHLNVIYQQPPQYIHLWKSTHLIKDATLAN